MRISQKELVARLALDYRVAMTLQAPCLGQVRAYSDHDSFASDAPILSDARSSEARIYRVEYKILTLRGPGEFMDGCMFKLDLLAGGNYPKTPPMVAVVSRPTPWSPHFSAGGAVCIGNGWIRARGKMLLAQLIIHIAKLLNFDEPGHGPGYIGYNAAAQNYWQRQLRGKPLDPDLAYPDLPHDVVHGIEMPPRFSPVKKRAFAPASSRAFAPVKNSSSRFKPTSTEVSK